MSPRCAIAALSISFWMVSGSLAVAQAPRAAPRASAPAAARPAPAPAPANARTTPAGENSVLRHRPWPTYASNDTYGYRNPGGVGRFAEYYPPGDKFQNDSPRHITAQIGNGGQPDRQEQLQAQMVGIQRYNALQSHIDRYGHPFGFGYGFGGAWGLGFGGFPN